MKHERRSCTYLSNTGLLSVPTRCDWCHLSPSTFHSLHVANLGSRFTMGLRGPLFLPCRLFISSSCCSSLLAVLSNVLSLLLSCVSFLVLPTSHRHHSRHMSLSLSLSLFLSLSLSLSPSHTHTPHTHTHRFLELSRTQVRGEGRRDHINHIRETNK